MMRMPKLKPSRVRQIKQNYKIHRCTDSLYFVFDNSKYSLKTSHGGPIRLTFRVTQHGPRMYSTMVNFFDFGRTGTQINGQIWLGRYEQLSRAVTQGFLRSQQQMALLYITMINGDHT